MLLVKQILKIIYFPLVSVFFIGAEIFISINELGFQYTILLMGCALVVSFMVERIIPYNVRWNDSQKDFARDIMHFLVNETMNYAGIFLLPFASIFVIFPEIWPSDWAFGFQLLFAILIFDIATTLCHFWSHKNSFLWRFHAIHHSLTRMYGFNGIMKHPLFQVFDAIFAIGPLIIIGIPEDVAIALIFCVFLQLLIQHSNADLKTGWFKHVFATAEVHRFHHLKGQAGDVNFALFFSIWDRLLGTAYFAQQGSLEDPLEDSQIGLEVLDYPKKYWQQMIQPF